MEICKCGKPIKWDHNAFERKIMEDYGLCPVCMVREIWAKLEAEKEWVVN